MPKSRILRRPLIHSALIHSAVLAVILSAIPILFGSGAEYFGQKTSAKLSETLLGESPGTAWMELTKIAAWTFACLFLLCLNHQYAKRYLPKRPVTLAIAGIATYFAFLCSYVLRYPAVFESWLATPLRTLIFAYLSFLPAALPMLILGSLWVIFWFAILATRRGLLFSLTGLGGSLAACALYWGGAEILGRFGHDSCSKVILIGIDSLRMDHIRPEFMPTLAKLLAQDEQTVSFRENHVGIPRTFPSWAEIMTGRPSAFNGVRHMFPSLRVKARAANDLPRLFQSLGYRTSVVSDFAGDIFPRINFGFDEIHTPDLNLDTVLRSSIQATSPLVLPFLMAAPSWLFPDLRALANFSDPFQLVRTSLSVLEQQDKEFQTIFFSTAHFPYAAPAPYYTRFADRSYRGPYAFQKVPNIYGGGEKLDAADRAQILALYRASLFAIDAALGEWIEQLKKSGDWDRSLIVITADHGEELFDLGERHGHGEHLRGNMVTQVPWILRLPASQKPARREIQEISRSVDIAPTIAGLLGQRMPHALGHDFSARILRAETPAIELTAASESGIWFSQTDGGFYQKDRIDYPGVSSLLKTGTGKKKEIVLDHIFEDVLLTSRHRAIQRGRWKLIYMPGRKSVHWLLFDRENDPLNQHDVKKQHPEVFAEMKQRFMRLTKKSEISMKFVDDYLLKR